MYEPYLSFVVGEHPLRPPTRRRLGEPLPRQQADGTKAAPRPLRLNVGALLDRLLCRGHRLLAPISRSYCRGRGTYQGITDSFATLLRQGFGEHSYLLLDRRALP